MNRILLWLRIIRPQTLFASVVPVTVGIAGIRYSHEIIICNHPITTALLTALCAVSLQVLSNLINDYYDFIRGADKAGRAGFKRALAEGDVNKRQMLRAIVITLATCLVLGVILVAEGGWPILLIGATAILFAWLYTATSHSLSYLGIADIFVFLYYGVVASSGTAYLLTGEFVPECFRAGAVSGLISMGVLMINNLRDMESDRNAGKKTLPVRFGKRAAELIYLFEIILMPLTAYAAFGLSVPMLILIPALMLWESVLKAHGAQYNKCLVKTGLLNVLYLFLILIDTLLF